MDRFQIAGAFRRDENGNFGVMFALVLAPIVALSGLAFDYARIQAAQTRLQAAVDAAILAAAAAGGRTVDMQRTAADMIAANSGRQDIAVRTVVDPYEMRVDARYTMKTGMMGLGGQPTAEIAAEAKLVSSTPLKAGRTSGGNPNRSPLARSPLANGGRDRGGPAFRLAR